MGREVLLAVLSCLALHVASARVFKISNGALIDNIGAESVSRLYRNVPLGVYASAAPYAAHTFQLPTYVAPNANQHAPIKEENVVLQRPTVYLMDSYGNKYQETPHSAAYKAAIPQQFVQLQNLPAHLNQPLGASPNFQFKQGTPHFFGPAQFTISNVQGYSIAPGSGHTQSQPIVYNSNVKNIAPQPAEIKHTPKLPTAQQQPSINKDVYVVKQSEDKTTALPQIKRPSTPAYTSTEQNLKERDHSAESETTQQRHQQLRDMPISTYVHGVKTIVNVPTKPPLPLLDLSLLEPLTFDNPLVPQVQHFLPRIHDASYHKLPDVNAGKNHHKEFKIQNTKSYDSGYTKGKPKSEVSKKKQKKRKPQNVDNSDEVRPTTHVNEKDHLSDAPEFTYEINSPNYKETYSEKKVSYNKETDSEPVKISYEKNSHNEPITYSYEKHVEKEPVHYTYVHDSKEPVQIKETYYHSESDQPKQVMYPFKSDEGAYNNQEERHTPRSEHIESYKQSPHEDHSQKGHDESKQKERHNEDQKYHNHETRDDHSTVDHQEKSNKNQHEENKGNDHSSYNGQINTPVEHVEQQFQAIIPEFDDEVTILPTNRPHITVHDDKNYNTQLRYVNKPNVQIIPSQIPQYTIKAYYPVAPVVQEKSKRIIIKEESPDSTSPDNKKLMDDMFKVQQENEESFERAYKNAAYGFPAYEHKPVDIEKDIYNPESYGVSKYNNEYDIANTPLQQYQVDGDDFPTYTRSNYKDARDKMKEGYFLDYAVSRPESLVDRFKNKENYYKMFANNKPERYYNDQRKSAKYSVETPFAYLAPKNREQSAKIKVSPYLYEFDYSNDAPRADNTAHATRPYQRYSKSKTHFVEPQFQYGFEPISIPRLLDSELAAMASNDNIESENPGTRKKVYKENWYIKKTTTGKAR